MCLSSISETVEPVSLIQSGWKEFDGPTAQPRFAAYSYKGTRDVPLDKWITAEGKNIKVSTFKHYDAGFHVYSEEQELKSRSQKRRVYYRNVHTRGTQDNLTVVIAKEIYVPSDPDAWPPRG